MKSQFIVPMVTPLTRERRLDEAAARDVIGRQVHAGISGVLVLGSIGEFFALHKADMARLIELAAQETRGKTPLIVGVASMDVQETIELMALAKKQGAQGVICVSPYYFNLPEQDILAYYNLVIPETNLDFYLYNFPARTGYDLVPELVCALAQKHKNIAGIKDSVPGMEHTRQILVRMRDALPDFRVFSGFDDNFAPNVLSGGAGCIGGLANIMPEVCMGLVNAMEREDLRALSALQAKLNDMMGLYSVAPLFVPAIKAAMRLRGMEIEEWCTQPIQGIKEGQREVLKALLVRNGLVQPE